MVKALIAECGREINHPSNGIIDSSRFERCIDGVGDKALIGRLFYNNVKEFEQKTHTAVKQDDLSSIAYAVQKISGSIATLGGIKPVEICQAYLAATPENQRSLLGNGYMVKILAGIDDFTDVLSDKLGGLISRGHHSSVENARSGVLLKKNSPASRTNKC